MTKKPTPWAKSKAKELLEKDIVEGRVTRRMMPIDIFKMRKEYEPYGIDRFHSN